MLIKTGEPQVTELWVSTEWSITEKTSLTKYPCQPFPNATSALQRSCQNLGSGWRSKGHKDGMKLSQKSYLGGSDMYSQQVISAILQLPKETQGKVVISYGWRDCKTSRRLVSQRHFSQNCLTQISPGSMENGYDNVCTYIQIWVLLMYRNLSFKPSKKAMQERAILLTQLHLQARNQVLR